MLAVLALALVATGGEIEAQQVPDYPGTSRILSIGGWSNIFTLEDRLIAVHYEATEVPLQTPLAAVLKSGVYPLATPMALSRLSSCRSWALM